MKKFNDFLTEDVDENNDKIKVLMLNCTLKASGESNTEALLKRVEEIYNEHDKEVDVEIVRVAEYKMDFGNSVDKLSDEDQFPEIYEKMLNSDIILIGSAIWFGERTSITQIIFERMIGAYGDTNDLGQPKLYGKVGGVVVTGNEDGVHGVASLTLFNLAHLGCTIPPNADCYWVGDAGPGKSYIEAGGEKHLYTNKTAYFLVNNTLHAAEMIKNNPYQSNLTELEEMAKKYS
jgi:multimeric flavodoxin WrbA